MRAVPGPQRRGIGRTGSGLLTLVDPRRATVTHTAHHAYRARGDLRDSDSMASKGVVLTRIRVADHLPESVSAQVSYDDVRAVIDAQIAYLGRRGLASGRTFDTVDDDLVVVDEDEPLAWVLGELDDRELTDAQVVTILRTEAGYQRSIGAVGSALAGDDPAT